VDKVVVIGGAGFVGSHVADELSRAGYQVTVFDAVESPWRSADQRGIIGDILDERAVADCVRGSRYVYHFAGIADIAETARRPLDTMRANVLGAGIALQACVEENVERFLFASTVYVYSRRGSFYRVSKQAAEGLIEEYQRKFQLPYTILRYGSLYGPRAQEWNGLKQYVSQAVRQGRLVFAGTGEERREYIHVTDAARLSVAALDAQYANSCLTLTGTEVLHSRELLRMIQEVVGNSVVVQFVPDSRDDDHYVVTPYQFDRKRSLKIVPEVFVDIGRGILELVRELENEAEQEN
jgi:UDP-glucose 4-epimerase